MEYLFDKNEFNDILNNLNESEIEKYENTPVDNKLLCWVKDNCKEHYLSLKKQSLINNVVNNFDDDENLEEYFNVWNYSNDGLRISMGAFSQTRAGALPTNDWVKNATFILSNKKLYIVNSGQYFDYISTEIIDFCDLSNLEKINLYKDNTNEVLEINMKSCYKKLYKTDKDYLSSLFNKLKQNDLINDKLQYMEGKKLPKGFFKYMSYYYIIVAILAMLLLIYTLCIFF